MPFDMIPDHIDFDVEFEDTKFSGKKYVLNANTGEYLGVVGKDFNCASHGDFIRNVVDTATNELGFHVQTSMIVLQSFKSGLRLL